MNKTKTIIISVFVVVLAAIGVTTAVLLNRAGAPAQQANSQQESTQTQESTEQNPNTVTFTAEADKTVLDQLKTHAEVVTKEASFGVYVDSINGIVGGTDGKYWSYYVDGQMAQIGAGEYTTTGGEKVEWKFE